VGYWDPLPAGTLRTSSQVRPAAPGCGLSPHRNHRRRFAPASRQGQARRRERAGLVRIRSGRRLAAECDGLVVSTGRRTFIRDAAKAGPGRGHRDQRRQPPCGHARGVKQPGQPRGRHGRAGHGQFGGRWGRDPYQNLPKPQSREAHGPARLSQGKTIHGHFSLGNELVGIAGSGRHAAAWFLQAGQTYRPARAMMNRSAPEATRFRAPYTAQKEPQADSSGRPELQALRGMAPRADLPPRGGRSAPGAADVTRAAAAARPRRGNALRQRRRWPTDDQRLPGPRARHPGTPGGTRFQSTAVGGGCRRAVAFRAPCRGPLAATRGSLAAMQAEHEQQRAGHGPAAGMIGTCVSAVPKRQDERGRRPGPAGRCPAGAERRQPRMHRRRTTISPSRCFSTPRRGTLVVKTAG